MKKRSLGQLLAIGSILTFASACHSNSMPSQSKSSMEDQSDDGDDDNDDGAYGDGDGACDQDCTRVEPATDTSDLQAETQEAIAPIVSIPESSSEQAEETSSPALSAEASQPTLSEVMSPEVKETLTLEAVNAVEIAAEHSSEAAESEAAAQN